MSKEILGSIYYKQSGDFQRGIYPIARTVKAEQHDLAVVYAVRGAEMEVKQIGNIMPTASRDNPNQGRVYDVNSLSPSITDVSGGGGRQPMIVAMRGRNPANPSDRTAGSPTEQRLEPNSQGICNTLTTVQKDNLLLEKAGFTIGGLQEHQTARTDGVSPSLTAAMGMGGGQTPLIPECDYRIRKLTPLECWRLMGFFDEDFLSAKLGSKQAAKETLEKYPHLGKRAFTEVQRVEKMSNSQLYKQAGNSIVKNVLKAIFGQMIPGKENDYKEL